MNRWIEDQWDNFVRKNIVNFDAKTAMALKKVYFAGARDGINARLVAEHKDLMAEITAFAEQVNEPKH